MPDKTRKIAIYSRKSKFTGKGESVENQIELCKNYINNHFPEITDENILTFEDEGFSGGHLVRPEFRKMMELVKQKKISYIVCYRLDRISRNLGDFAGLINELNNLDTGFISIKEQFDPSTSMGRAMMFVASVFSQLERETIAERIRDNMYELAKTGRWLGGTTPIGYKSEQVEKITVDGKKRTAFKLVQIAEEIAIVKLIYSKFIETNSLTQTETYLLQNNYKSKKGKNFSRHGIRFILKNPVYMIADKTAYNYFADEQIEIFAEETEFNAANAIMAYNKTAQKQGKAHEIQDMCDWIIAVGKHEGIIDGKTWVQIQKNLDVNKSKSYRKARSHVALLSGLLRCGDCGEFMRPKMGRQIAESGERKYSYLCSLKERSRSQNCNMKNPYGNDLDKLVCDTVKNLSADPKVFFSELASAQKQLLGNKTDANRELKRLEKLKKENETAITNLTKSLINAAGTSAEQHILKEIEKYDAELKRTNDTIVQITNSTVDSIITNNEFELLKDMLSNFAQTYDDMTIEQKRAAIRVVVKKVVWDGKNAHIYLFGHSDDDFDPPKLHESGIEEPLCENSKRTANEPS